MAEQNFLKIELDENDRKVLDRYLEKVIDGLASMDAFWDAVEMYMIDSLTQNFEAGGRPNKWEPLSPVTIELKGSDGILQDRGHLKQSVNASNVDRGDRHLEIWAGERHGLYHQDPDTDPSRQWGMTNRRGTPFRPFILFQDEDVKQIEQILIRYIDDVMR